MKKMITLFAVLGMVLALAPTAQAALATGMSSVLRDENLGAGYTDVDMGTSIGNGDYALGNFDVTDTDAYRNYSGTMGFGHENNQAAGRGWVAADVLTGGVADFLAGAQYLATYDGDQVNNGTSSAQYQITFDKPGTFYMLQDSRSTPSTTGYTDTGVDISFTQHGAAFNVWSQDVIANQTVTTPLMPAMTMLGFAFQPDPPPAGTVLIIK